MKFSSFFIFCAFCVFQVKSDLITDFSKTVEEASAKILNYEEEFSNSVILTLSNLKDASMEANSKALEAILDQAQALSGQTETKEQKDCIDSARQKFGDKVTQMVYSLDSCVQGPKALGDPIRKKLQTAFETTLKIKEDLEALKSKCSSQTDKPGDECISLKINEMKGDLNKLLEEAQMDSIAGETLKSKISSEALKCNSDVSTELSKVVTEYQGLFKNCI